MSGTIRAHSKKSNRGTDGHSPTKAVKEKTRKKERLESSGETTAVKNVPAVYRNGQTFGRPNKYRPELCQIVVEQMRKGAAIEELPFYLEVCLDTIYEWSQKYDDFSEALNQGRSFSRALWMIKGRENLDSDTFNSTLWYMNMKNRFGWRDKTENNINVTLDDSTERVANIIDVCLLDH